MTRPNITGSTFSGYLMPRSTGWVVCSRTGHHALAGFFDPFACKKIRVEVTVIEDAEDEHEGSSA